MAALKGRGTIVMGTATTVAEAQAWEAVGADAICAQGSEAGAHRGTFLGDFDGALIGTMALVPQIVDAVRVPVVAAGGIMDGRGIAASLMLGAAGVQMGTAFLTCPESGAPEAHKRAIPAARADTTVITRAFSGRPARGLTNAFIAMVAGKEDSILPFRQQNDLTRPMRNAAGQQGIADFISLWAGRGVARSRAMLAADLVKTLVDEMLRAEVIRP